MSNLEEIDLNQDLVFTGPITQEELIITWKKRRQERLERERAEAEALQLEAQSRKSEARSRESEAVISSATEALEESEESAEESERNSDRILEPDTAIPSTAEVVGLPPKPTSTILRPARLNVDSTSFTTDWAKRINMKKLDKPKRPEYVQPLE